MKTRRLITMTLATSLLAGITLTGTASAAPEATVRILGTPEASLATDINARGDVIGTWSGERRPRNPGARGFVRTAEGVQTDFYDPTGAHFGSEASAINRKGAVAGNFVQAVRTGPWRYQPFVWTAKLGAVALPAIAGERLRAVDIDDQGRVLVNGDNRAYLYDPASGTYATLPGLGISVTANDMNESGQIVGAAYVDGGWHAVAWTGKDHLVRNISGTLPGETKATKINDNGEIIGGADTGANFPNKPQVAHWESPSATPTVLGAGTATDLNNRGCIVGTSYAEVTSTPVAWRVRNKRVEIQPLGHDFLPKAVNRHGEIAGSAPVGTGRSGAVYSFCPV